MPLQNLLLLTGDRDLSKVVLIDFGLSRFFEVGQRLMTRVGTVYYTAPEVWAERYDNKCDLFSCGVLLYVLLCLYTPFDGDDDNDILRKVMRGEFHRTGPVASLLSLPPSYPSCALSCSVH